MDSRLRGKKTPNTFGVNLYTTPQGQLAKEVHKGKGWTTRMTTLEKRQVLFQLSLTRSETS